MDKNTPANENRQAQAITEQKSNVEIEMYKAEIEKRLKSLETQSRKLRDDLDNLTKNVMNNRR